MPEKYPLFDELKFSAGALAGALVIRLISASCRVTVLGAENDPLDRRGVSHAGRTPIYAAWHQRMFAFFDLMGGRRVGVMISTSRDGEMVSRAAAHLGFKPIRGSSTRRGVSAMRRLIGFLRRGKPVGFLADGPKGPARAAKMGVVAASREKGDPIVPLAFGADRKWVLRSWDRYLIPKPFARVVVVVGKPVIVRPGCDREEMEEARLKLEAELDALCDRADLAASARPCRQTRSGGPRHPAGIKPCSGV